MELNQQILDNLDDWADLLVERVFYKEMIGIPDSVAAVAAIRFVASLSRRNSNLLPKGIVIKLLEKELEHIEDTTLLA